MRVIPTFCAPRSGNQKGTVERLVGFVKASFFLARKFKDRDDAVKQLGEWLHAVNHERPCDATGRVPASALQDEVRWLVERPLTTTAEEWPIRETLTVTGAIKRVRFSSQYHGPSKPPVYARFDNVRFNADRTLPILVER